ncbi:unnamed protein product [Protopolystoma xenopodis]|uniref:Uncharacterized protein n=1 Tax=Protopolystoma xenopodis TaxID=117903 RepID=A0A448WRY6_9PLAT|nr:unnamed protein product [Protopolystoma xenopodis]
MVASQQTTTSCLILGHNGTRINRPGQATSPPQIADLGRMAVDFAQTVAPASRRKWANFIAFIASPHYWTHDDADRLTPFSSERMPSPLEGFPHSEASPRPSDAVIALNYIPVSSVDSQLGIQSPQRSIGAGGNVFS